MGSKGNQPGSEPQPTFSSGRLQQDDGAGPPELRILHYNDVYHVDGASAEPVGGLARFMTLIKEYQEGPSYVGQPKLLTLFSGDAFNPSLESSVTKGSSGLRSEELESYLLTQGSGRHMVPVLNAIETDCACVGNHDFDFGVDQFRHLARKCNFPWLLANVEDPALGDGVPMGNAEKTHLMTTSNGLKVGLIGLGEREWLVTINTLPPNIIYKSATATAKELVPKLRAAGADIVICLSHMREPNDIKLAEQTDGLMDIILGGHDHYYDHSLVKGTHVLRSGTDFKQLSYIEGRRKRDGSRRWDVDIWRRDITLDVPEHGPTAELVHKLTSKLQRSLARPVGWTAVPLDARFSTVRLQESNLGNFVCDVMRRYHNADCTIMASGTIRGDQIYPPGAVCIKDITTCFPFEDPVVLLAVKGSAIREALENGVSTYPALEGRFPQVSNIVFEFDPSRKAGERVTSLHIGGESYDAERKYRLATRGYMGRGKDGYTSLLVRSEGGHVEELIDEEHGILISAMLRQYFMGLRTIGQWQKLADHWVNVAQDAAVPTSSAHTEMGTQHEAENPLHLPHGLGRNEEGAGTAWHEFLHRLRGLHKTPLDDDNDDAHFDPHVDSNHEMDHAAEAAMDFEVLLLRKFWARWVRKAGVKPRSCDPLKEAEFLVDWTRLIAPCLEGRIKNLGQIKQASYQSRTT